MRTPLLTNDEIRDNQRYRREALELISSGEAIAFVGAGLSVELGYPTWPQLSEKLTVLAREVGEFEPPAASADTLQPEYADAVKEFILAQTGSLDRYHGFLGREFGQRDPAFTRVQADLLRLPLKALITSNYEPSLQCACAHVYPGETHLAITIHEQHAHLVSQFLVALSRKTIPGPIAHLHGSYVDPAGMVVAATDYQDAYGLRAHPGDAPLEGSPSWPLRRRLLWALLASRRLVFFGFSMDDVDFQVMLRSVANDLWNWGESIHYAIMGIGDIDPDATKKRAAQIHREFGVRVVFYENTDESHSGVSDSLPMRWLLVRRPVGAGTFRQLTDARTASHGLMKIDRSKLISELQDFAVAANGVIIGAPGVGKSYVLRAVRDGFMSSERPAVIIPVDQLGSVADDDLRAFFPGGGDWTARLAAIARAQRVRPAVLIFDGFDAARSEERRVRLLGHIGKAVAELGEQWRVLVSVRSWDARKSGRLLDLFPADLSSTADVPCRHFTVLPLSQDEVAQAYEQIPGLERLYEEGSADFRRLLTIPFHLWLLEKILKGDGDVAGLSSITSEAQLLDRYWRRRVLQQPSRTGREFLLANITRMMVNEHALSVRKDQVYQPAAKNEWDELLSEEVLVEPSGAAQRVMFSHNILFDFAVAALLLEDDPRTFAEFVAEEPARPLFLRPSLVYHFTRQWHSARPVFWKNFQAVVRQDQLHLRQIVRLVLPAVVTSEARIPEDLVPLLAGLRDSADVAREAFSFVLQALRVLRTQNVLLWSNVLRSASEHIGREFSWDLGLVANMLFASASNDALLKQNCGIIGRNLLRWAWQRRKENPEPWLDRLVAVVAIPLVAKSYDTDVTESRALLKAVLSVTGDANFPIDCIYRLTDEVDRIIPHDPNFVGEVYETVFGYQETSEEKTNIGGPVLTLISNRRQEYEGCQYHLIQLFPRFLAAAPQAAAQAGIRALNAFALRRHVLPNLKPGHSVADLTDRFVFRGKETTYTADMSAIWDETQYPDQPLQIASNLFAHIEALSRDMKREALEELLDVIANEGGCAFLWSRLLLAGAEAPAGLANLLQPLCNVRPVLCGTDTLFALGAFVEQAGAFLSREELAQIERSILQSPEACGKEVKPEISEHRRNRLLARIPRERLVTTQAQELRQQLELSDELPPNRPLYEISTKWSDYTEDQFLRERGAEPDSTENKELRALYEPLRAFKHKWMNKSEPKQDSLDLLPAARVLFAALQQESGANPLVISAAFQHLAEYAQLVAKHLTSSDSDEFRFVKEVMLRAAEDPSPQPEPEADAAWDSAAWSPAPRHEAAQALPWLTHFGADPELFRLIEKLAVDPVPSVRFLLSSELWRTHENAADVCVRLLRQLAEQETNLVVLDGVAASLWNLIPRDRVTGLAILRILYSRIPQQPNANFVEDVVAMITDYIVWDNEEWATSVVDTWNRTPVESAGFVDLAGRRLVSYLTPEQNARTFAVARGRLLQTIGAVTQGVAQLKRIPPVQWDDDTRAVLHKLYNVIDDAVLRIYFAIDLNENLRTRKEHPLTDGERKQFFTQVLPVLEEIVTFALDERAGILFAPTAHHFIELINGVLKYDPPTALRLAAEVVRASRPHGYNFDSLAMKEIVRLVEAILADHRGEIQDESSIRFLLNLLDAFVEAGWPDALQLVWRLDEIYR